MTAMSPWKMAENSTSIDVPYVDRRAYVNVRSVYTWLCHLNKISIVHGELYKAWKNQRF